MRVKPFLKWAGGKRWLTDRNEFRVPSYSGRYIEPFLGGGAIFFHLAPKSAYLSDSNQRLIEAYQAICSDWRAVQSELQRHQSLHSPAHYYDERSREYADRAKRAAQFIYLNRTCWNGLYRENLKGQFNVPIGTKSQVVLPEDNFEHISSMLSTTKIVCCDFEETIDEARAGDFLFVDPPYTTAHNFNGFVKYNQNIFKWEDQIRLRNAVDRAAKRGCKILLTNAAHETVNELYSEHGEIVEISRASVISGNVNGRRGTKEILIRIGFKVDQ